jgi:hypothetical protein
MKAVLAAAIASRLSLRKSMSCAHALLNSIAGGLSSNATQGNLQKNKTLTLRQKALI